MTAAMPRSVGADLPYVLVVGGFSTPRAALYPVMWQLRAAGYEVGTFAHRMGLDCSERTYRRLLARVAELADHPAGVLALAYSRGGQFTKVLAVRNPGILCAVVGFGVPVAPGVDMLGERTRRRILAASRIGDIGVPGLVTSSCLTGGCCEAFWADLQQPWPESLTVRSVYAMDDTVVDGKVHAADSATVTWIPGTHRELVTAEASRLLAVDLVRDLSRQAGPRSIDEEH